MIQYKVYFVKFFIIGFPFKIYDQMFNIIFASWHISHLLGAWSGASGIGDAINISSSAVEVDDSLFFPPLDFYYLLYIFPAFEIIDPTFP